MTNRLWLAVLLLVGCVESDALHQASPTNGDRYATAAGRRDSVETLGDSLRSAANRLTMLADSLGVSREGLDESGVLERWDGWIAERIESGDRYRLFTGCAPVVVSPYWALLEVDDYGDLNPYAAGRLPGHPKSARWLKSACGRHGCGPGGMRWRGGTAPTPDAGLPF